MQFAVGCFQSLGCSSSPIVGSFGTAFGCDALGLLLVCEGDVPGMNMREINLSFGAPACVWLFQSRVLAFFCRGF